VTVCSGTKRNGEPCTLPAMAGSSWCWNHDPARAEERRESARRAATMKHSSIGRELREVRELIWELLGILLSERLPFSVKIELQNVVQLLQCYLRAAELEMRAAEEPLKSDLDVAGLRAQVLERIEVLEEREREREELLAEVLSEFVPAMEARSFATGAVKAVLGG
jgi:hypothetical protein